MFFMGTYTPKLDDKGRLFLPAKFRDQLAEGLVVTRGQEFCLTVWPMADFVELTRPGPGGPGDGEGARVTTRASSSPVRRRRRRTSRAGSRSRRCCASTPALERDVVVIGVMNRIEIWDPARWQQYSAEQETKFSELSEEVFPGV